MNNEIKEILEDLKNKDISVDDLTHNDKVKLLDYITNLQTIEQQYSAILSENAELENKITNLQEKNESQKENLLNLNKTIKKVKKENKNMREYAEYTLDEYIDYKSRNEKAREYINKHTTSFKDIFIPASESWYLLELLNGGDDNE